VRVSDDPGSDKPFRSKWNRGMSSPCKEGMMPKPRAEVGA